MGRRFLHSQVHRGWLASWGAYNSDGLRDREHAIEKGPGTRRVVCLGDSVTQGFGLLPEQAWPQVLEELLQSHGSDDEVFNVALGSWTTQQELIAYRRIARKYHPGLVLLGICLDDVPEMQNNLTRPPRWFSSLYRRSALVRRRPMRRRWGASRRPGLLGAAAEPAIPLLVAALDEPLARVRCSAAWALGKIGAAAKPGVPRLIQSLSDPGRRGPSRIAAGRHRDAPSRNRQTASELVRQDLAPPRPRAATAREPGEKMLSLVN